mmetsp:Transcript_83760/g.251070  ORF Transcript_83760/g.251070 Transcript_83760/m.251070 type:complete len:277 (+) Transcript_83760:276-1106(+)
MHTWASSATTTATAARPTTRAAPRACTVRRRRRTQRRRRRGSSRTTRRRASGRVRRRCAQTRGRRAAAWTAAPRVHSTVWAVGATTLPTPTLPTTSTGWTLTRCWRRCGRRGARVARTRGCWRRAGCCVRRSWSRSRGSSAPRCCSSSPSRRYSPPRCPRAPRTACGARCPSSRARCRTRSARLPLGSPWAPPTRWSRWSCTRHRARPRCCRPSSPRPSATRAPPSSGCACCSTYSGATLSSRRQSWSSPAHRPRSRAPAPPRVAYRPPSRARSPR